MADGGAGCGPPCQAKIILNGDIDAKILLSVCESIERFFAAGNTFPNKEKVLKYLMRVDDAVSDFERVVMEQQGYTGPWPKRLPSPNP